MRYSSIGMFSGAGGLDLGFEQAGFAHLSAMDSSYWCVASMQKNRPEWGAVEADAMDWSWTDPVDVLLAGPPCQGYSLGGNRHPGDDRNQLYRQVLRVASACRPRVIIIENVLNLRTLVDPGTGRSFHEQIPADLEDLGYAVRSGVFRMDGFGVPQTRRRWIFVGFRDGFPDGYQLPHPLGVEPVQSWLYELGQGGGAALPNHEPAWGFRSTVHTETGDSFDAHEPAVIVRFSRTASDGHPVRSFDQAMPAVDTATIWGWAQGHVTATRVAVDRTEGAKYIRNRNADLTLWRISASRLRSMTHREYARLQTFPDDWVFLGNNKRDVHLQIGNAVPVAFARRLGLNVRSALEALDTNRCFVPEGTGQQQLF
jgi:DNA (cytosine-5)-methyltransferase 1